MKILLVSPDTPNLWVPRMLPMQGILYIASAIRELGIEPLLWDMNYDPHQYDNADDIDILMITANSATYAIATRVAERIKAKVKIVGGCHSTTLPEDCIAPDSPFDVACIGEGEQTVKEMISAISGGDLLELTNVPGVCFRHKGYTYITPERAFLPIDSIAWPAYDLWPELGNVAAVASEGEPVGPGCSIFSSRGCPFSCNFCNTIMWKRKTRFRDVDDVIEEAKYLRDRFGISHLRIQDDTFNLNKPRFEKLCYGLKSLDMFWRAHTRTDHVSLEEFKMMKECGCVELAFGIESGSQRMLDLMNKKNTLENHANAIKWANEVGLHCRVFLILGFPGETWESVQETVDFVKKTKPYKTSFTTFVPYPGCDVWNNPDKYNAKILSRDWDQYWTIGLEETDKGFLIEFPSMSHGDLIKARAYMLSEFTKIVGSRDRRTEVKPSLN